MGAMKVQPRYNVVSLRISDKEREVLELFVQKTHRSVSQLMREALELQMHKMKKA
ncbi:MAG: ribbon-helix-helix protein, CopG family [Desulfuromonadaceae bacterium GWB2_53_15]|nr:MAG: ribbon-helix-helix protein, CopG family [Desulfuromonadales bacterium GWD2_54_10]OHB32070.1 MAG: ribbon-helix-helix protein, CopG family [Desulfuromonadaceae bacterium GWB2_53_15]